MVHKLYSTVTLVYDSIIRETLLNGVNLYPNSMRSSMFEKCTTIINTENIKLRMQNILYLKKIHGLSNYI